MPEIYRCEGKHFKVYNSDLKQVIEHPDEQTPVSVIFSYDENFLKIKVKGFVIRSMRKQGQKNRGDIYILQHKFEPVLKILEKLIDQLGINGDPEEQWRFGRPFSREGRQGVPVCVKLAEVSEISLTAPFSQFVFHINHGFLVVDSEIPGRDQSLWVKQGGERQIHIGVWGSDSITQEKMPEVVTVYIPIKRIENSFLRPIQQNWIS